VALSLFTKAKGQFPPVLTLPSPVDLHRIHLESLEDFSHVRGKQISFDILDRRNYIACSLNVSLRWFCLKTLLNMINNESEGFGMLAKSDQ